VPVSFGTLVVIVLAGLGGPLLGIAGHRFVPVVIGEILAGILVGPTVLDAVNPANGSISFLAEIGFAMLMLTVGMHLPLREKRLAAALRSGGLLAGIVCVCSRRASRAPATPRSTSCCSPPDPPPCCSQLYKRHASTLPR